MAVGDRVDPARIGERVLIEPCIRKADGETLETPRCFRSKCDGRFAEFARVAARHAYPVESHLSDVKFASLPRSYSTTENMLIRAGVTAGETVLVTRVYGGVGTATVQLAAARGAKVVAVTRALKADRLKARGAEVTLERDDN